jgi:hypothetical protein
LAGGAPSSGKVIWDVNLREFHLMATQNENAHVLGDSDEYDLPDWPLIDEIR